MFPISTEQKVLNILAVGDSLTAGYYNYGLAFHPYARDLTILFQSVNQPVNVTQRGVSGERVVPTMATRLERMLEKNVYYDWIIILGGTNDLGYGASAEKIFKEGLEPMYEMCLKHNQGKAKLAVMTVIENAINSPEQPADKNRQTLNKMIRDYVNKTTEPNRVCLVDLDQGIPYHSVKDSVERKRIWDDSIHLTAAGYSRMAKLIFDTMQSKL